MVADRRLTVTTPAGSGALTLYLSEDWDRPQPAITRAVVTVHGALRNADVYRASAEKALAVSRVDPKAVLLIEPQFLDDADVASHHLPDETLHWADVGWEGGDDAHGPAPISGASALRVQCTTLVLRRRRDAQRRIAIVRMRSCSARGVRCCCVQHARRPSLVRSWLAMTITSAGVPDFSPQIFRDAVCARRRALSSAGTLTTSRTGVHMLVVHLAHFARAAATRRGVRVRV